MALCGHCDYVDDLCHGVSNEQKSGDGYGKEYLVRKLTLEEGPRKGRVC